VKDGCGKKESYSEKSILGYRVSPCFVVGCKLGDKNILVKEENPRI